MSGTLRTAWRTVSTAFVLFACAPGPGSPPPRSAPSEARPPSSVSDSILVQDTTASTADTLYAVGLDQPAGSLPGFVVSLAAPPGVDARELLDGGATLNGHRPDILVTRDAQVLAYAAVGASYFAVALPWNSTYVLLPARATGAVVPPPAAERDALARNSVTVDARGAAEPFQWLTDSACAAPVAAGVTSSRGFVVFASGDSAARQLAERVASLVGANPPAPWIAAAIRRSDSASPLRVGAMPADSLPGAVTAGAAVAAVLAVARDPHARCGTGGNTRVPADAIPLVDVRSHVLVRRGSGAAFVVSASGWFRFFRRGAR